MSAPSNIERAVTFVPLDESNVELVESMHREVYPPEMVIWDKYSLMSDVFIERQIGRYSFLLHGSTWLGHCISFMSESMVKPGNTKPILYIADMVVRNHMQGNGYGRIMCEEVLRRAQENAISHIELYARESTSYSAIHSSSHTDDILNEFGYVKTEHHQESVKNRFKKVQKFEHGRLISLEKIENNT
jgi:hypothetical protein